MNAVTRYCLGFMFDHSGTKVALIRKARPEWQRGLLNGIGGHIESGEFPHDSMRREFLEEAGVDVEDWANFHALSGESYFVACFCCRGDLSLIVQKTDEPIEIIEVSSLTQRSDVISNLHWLIPMAQDQMGLIGQSPFTPLKEGKA